VDGRPPAVDWAAEKETWEKLQSEEQHAGDGGSAASEGNTYGNDSKKTLPAESNELERTSEKYDGESATSSESESMMPTVLIMKTKIWKTLASRTMKVRKHPLPQHLSENCPSHPLTRRYTPNFCNSVLSATHS
jgi:hypothetical protein